MRVNDPRRTDYVENFDDEAAAFLRAYGYGNLVDEPQPVPIREIAEKRMLLDIVDTECLSPDEAIQGIITFTGGIVDVYDLEQGEFIGYEASRGMVFVDTLMSNEGRINNTLAHECYHWYKHRRYFLYKELHEGDSGQEFGFRCKTQCGSLENKASYSDEERMEYQARMVAPKILMPKNATEKKIKQIYSTLQKEDEYVQVVDVIEKLANFFHVSKQAAAIRMTELGYPEAEPYCTYQAENDDWRRKRRVSSRAVLRQQKISIVDAFALYLQNDYLRLVLDTGAFRYIDGYFVLNDAKYMEDTGDDYRLNEYGREHLAECTLDFSFRMIRLEPRAFSEGLLFHQDGLYKKIPSFDATAQNAENYNHAKALQNIERAFDEQFQRHQLVHESTTGRFWKYMQIKKWNTSIFQEKTLLGPMDYSRVQDSTHIFKIPAYIAMAVGLELGLADVQEALHLSGLGFDLQKKEHSAYAFILTSFQGCSIDECNEVLKQLDVPLLGAKSRK